MTQHQFGDTLRQRLTTNLAAHAVRPIDDAGLRQAAVALAEGRRRASDVFGGNGEIGSTAGSQGGGAALHNLVDWLNETTESELSEDEFAPLERDALAHRVEAQLEERFRPEMRRMERALMLQILDTAWKEHLLSMDHLFRESGALKFRPCPLIKKLVRAQHVGTKTGEGFFTYDTKTGKKLPTPFAS